MNTINNQFIALPPVVGFPPVVGWFDLAFKLLPWTLWMML